MDIRRPGKKRVVQQAVSDKGQPQPVVPTVSELPSVHATSNKKSLAIAIVVATLFLIAAIAVAAWLFLNKTPSQNSTTNTATSSADDPKNVATVRWIAPDPFPAGYAWSDHSTDAAHINTYYTDATAGCSIAARVLPSTDDNESAAGLAGEGGGITTATIAGPGDPLTIVNSETGREYSFTSIEVDQKVSVPGVDFDKQSGSAYYLQFGDKLAVIDFTCKLASLSAKTTEIINLIRQFKIKTE